MQTADDNILFHYCGAVSTRPESRTMYFWHDNRIILYYYYTRVYLYLVYIFGPGRGKKGLGQFFAIKHGCVFRAGKEKIFVRCEKCDGGSRRKNDDKN